jgi:transposase-like protein
MLTAAFLKSNFANAFRYARRINFGWPSRLARRFSLPEQKRKWIKRWEHRCLQE